MWCCCFVLVVFVIFCLIYLFSRLITPRPLNITGSHVLITGGSSGIGKALAVEAVQKGANVTIVARNQKRLQEAKQEIEAYLHDNKSQRVNIISEDITKDPDSVRQAIQKAEGALGPIDVLINNAGSAIAGRFEETPPQEFKRMMDLNFLGSVYVTQAAITQMKRNKRGRIVFVSSQAGQVGVFGYTAYSSSKFALRGFAESLQMEVKPYNIYITIACPPDTDTPGFAEENKSKPVETQMISDTVGLFSPATVAKSILTDSLNGRFVSYIGMDGYLLATVSCGMSPATSVLDLIQQVFIMGLFRFVSQFYILHFDRIIRKCKENRENKVKSS